MQSTAKAVAAFFYVIGTFILPRIGRRKARLPIR